MIEPAAWQGIEFAVFSLPTLLAKPSGSFSAKSNSFYFGFQSAALFCRSTLMEPVSLFSQLEGETLWIHF